MTLRRFLVAAALPSALALGLAGCHHKRTSASAPQPPPPVYETPSHSPRSARTTPPERPETLPPEPVPQGRPISSEVGLASWYGPPYANRKGADGTVYNENAMTAAHRTLPMGTIVRVTNLANGRSVTVKITDRGPFVGNRILDLSLAAAKALDVYRVGVAKVRIDAFAPPVHPGQDPGGRWCVQIGAFVDPSDAVQLKNDLARRYRTARVIEFAGPTGHWVRISPVHPDRSTAQQIADSIHVPEAEPYLVRLN